MDEIPIQIALSKEASNFDKGYRSILSSINTTEYPLFFNSGARARMERGIS
jgi:hypothetical protein